MILSKDDVMGKILKWHKVLDQKTELPKGRVKMVIIGQVGICFTHSHPHLLEVEGVLKLQIFVV